MANELWRVPAGETDVDEMWQWLTDEPPIRGIDVWTDRAAVGWLVEVGAQELLGLDPLGVELRQRMESALRAVDGVTDVTEADHESWLVCGNPSGPALVQAAAKVVEGLADQMRAWIASSGQRGRRWPPSPRQMSADEATAGSKPGPAGKKSPLPPVRIASTETVYMTPQEYDNAVEALAVLVSRHRARLASDPARSRAEGASFTEKDQ